MPGFVCHLCNARCGTKSQLQRHLKGKKHRKLVNPTTLQQELPNPQKTKMKENALAKKLRQNPMSDRFHAYNPAQTLTLRNNSMQSVYMFIAECEEWDKVETEQFTADGEEWRVVRHFKYFDEQHSHYIEFKKYFARARNVANFSYLCRHGYSSTMEREFGEGFGGAEKYNPERDSGKYRQMRSWQRDQEDMRKALSVVDQFFGNPDTFQFHSVATDDAFSVDISDLVAFGDFGDIQSRTPLRRCAWINGPYVASIVYPFSGEGDPYTIFHHSSVSVQKLMHQILRLNDWDGFFPNVPNTINRYDWCEWRFGGVAISDDDDGKDDHSNNAHKKSASFCKQHPDLLYFAQSKSVSKLELKQYIQSGNVEQSGRVKHLYKIFDENKKVVSIAVDISVTLLGDWLYGKLLQDQKSNKHFALVVNGFVPETEMLPSTRKRIEEKYPNLFTSIKQTKLMFDMATMTY